MIKKVTLGLLLCALTVPAMSQTSTEDLDKKELQVIAAKEKKLVEARKVFFKNPKDKKGKANYISTTLDLAEFILVSPALGAKEKYPRSLKLYREILRTDASHKKALERVSLIESIYKQMGRKVPG